MPVGYMGGYTPKNKIHSMQKRKRFTREETQNENLTLALFKTEWNGACQIVSMIYDDLAESYRANAGFFTVDYEEDPELSSEFGIREVPTILFFKEGQLVDHAVGLTAKNELISKIESALNPDSQSIH